MNNKIILGIVIVAILAIGGYLLYDSSGSGATVSAQGMSTIKVVPDQVSVNINVETKNTTALLAQEANKVISDALLFELVKIGFKSDELKFVNFNVYEDFDWNNGDRTSKGFVVSQQLVVKTDQTSRVPSIVDAAIRSGALVSYIDFQLSDAKQSEIKNKALEEASKDAMAKASAIAAGQGKRLGGLVSIKNQDIPIFGPYRYYDYAMGASAEMNAVQAKSAAINIAPNEQEITASIIAEYKIR